MVLNNTMEYIGHNPIIGATITIAHLVLAAILPSLHTELPLIVMQLFQMGAWSIAMMVGMCTMYWGWKSHKKSNHKDEK